MEWIIFAYTKGKMCYKFLACPANWKDEIERCTISIQFENHNAPAGFSEESRQPWNVQKLQKNNLKIWMYVCVHFFFQKWTNRTCNNNQKWHNKKHWKLTKQISILNIKMLQNENNQIDRWINNIFCIVRIVIHVNFYKQNRENNWTGHGTPMGSLSPDIFACERGIRSRVNHDSGG